MTDAKNQARILANTFYIRQPYTKTEYQISIRDGVKLYTIVYAPKDADEVRFPSYSTARLTPSGPTAPLSLSSIVALAASSKVMHEGYIFAYQDMRGRYTSEGEFLNMRLEVEKHATKKDIDEGSDACDTIDCLLPRAGCAVRLSQGLLRRRLVVRAGMICIKWHQ